VNTGVLAVRDVGGASLDGSGYGGGADSRPGYFGLVRAQLPFGGGSNIGVLAGVHTQDALNSVAPAAGGFMPDVAHNEFAGVDAQLKLSDRWDMETQAATTATHSDSIDATGAKKSTTFSDGISVLRLNYRDGVRSLHVGVRYVGPRFRDELGYQERIGVVYKHAVFEWNFDPKGGPLQRIDPVMDVLLLHDHTSRPEYADIYPHVELVFRKNFYAYAGGHEIVEHWISRNYSQERVDMYFEDTRWRPLTWNLQATLGDGIYYGATDAESYLAWTENYTLNATVRPSSRVTAAASVLHYRLAHRPTSGEVVNQWLVGVNMTAQFTTRLSARLYPQYDTSTRHLDGNALLSYVVHPGTVVYVGVNSGFDHVGGRQRATGREIFIKASYRLAV
jgi:hypothetical protein